MHGTANLIPATLPAEYADLVRLYAPQAIHDAVGHENAMEVVNALLEVPHLSAGQAHYLETVSILVAAYERDHRGFDTSDLTGLDMLRHAASENDMSVADVAAVLGTDEPTAAAVLAGTRPVTADHAAALGRRFGVNSRLFV